MQDVLSRRRPIGELPLAVGPVCLGAVGSANVIRAAYDAGINFFSIAVDMHWPLYEPVRRGLASKRSPRCSDSTSLPWEPSAISIS